jgi:cell division cycle 14
LILFKKGLFYFSAVRTQPDPVPSIHYFTVDNVFFYEPFFADFGPLNIGHVHNFCKILDSKIEVSPLGLIFN